MKRITLLYCLFLTFIGLGQASFSGNVKEIETNTALKNVKLMVVTESDTSYILPDEKGNFDFKTKPGRVKIFAIADGYISELNSLNAGDKSTNKLDISMIKEAKIKDLEKREIKAAGVTPSTYHYSVPSSSGAPDRGSVFGEDSVEEVEFYDGTFEGTVPTKRMIPYEHEEDLIAKKNTGRGGILTAGEVNDFAKWELWNDLKSTTFQEYSDKWRFKLMERFCVQFSLPSGMPLIDATVELTDNNGYHIWSARTDNTGKAELWDLNVDLGKEKKYFATVIVGSFTKTFKNIHSFKRGINTFEVDVPCTVSDQLDIAFVVDATGSMGDEINYLKLDLDSVISLIAMENKHINVRMGSVFYRDKGDQYLTIESPFSSNNDLIKAFIRSNVAGGGGDTPEAADEALLAALQKLNWSNNSRARILFWILDAPPHQAEENLTRMKEVIELAAKMGVRIVPVGCSGIDKATEFLCRNVALATNGTYTFLTNHSGVGGSHIEPSTDGYKVESFREIMVRIARTMSLTPDCNEFIAPEQIVLIDTNIRVENPFGTNDSLFQNRPGDSTYVQAERPIIVYPNPTDGMIHIKHSEHIQQLFIADINGKLLDQVKINQHNRVIDYDLGRFTNGVYFIRFYDGTRWRSLRVILQHT